jgi:hypothetical protein
MNDSTKKLLTTIRFEGPRFEDHGLDLDVLSELSAYKKLILETAKEVWRADHPERERLPRGFEESFSVKMYGINPGSAAVDLTRIRTDSDDQLEIPFEQEDSFDKAAVLLEESMTAMASDTNLPDAFPQNIIPMFKDLGSTLRDDESIIAKSPNRTSPSQYDRTVRERFINWQDPTYEDEIDLVGEVRKADLDGCSFSIRLQDGKKVEGRFSSDQERVVINALQDHDTTHLRLVGRGTFNRQSGALQRIITVDDLTPIPATGIEYDETERPIWEIAQEIGAEVPDEEWSKVPRDMAENLDHYLYGTPKRES